MLFIKIFWVFNFFVFALLLLFVWSKIYIISKKLQSAAAVVEKIDALSEQLGERTSAPAAAAAKAETA